MNSLTKNLEGPIKRIILLQREDGCIPWTEDGVFDAWNHLECVMALNTLGHSREAELGFTYLQKNQLEAGSWLGELGSTLEIDENRGTFINRDKNSKIFFRDTNFAAYIATACWHDFLVNKSINNLTKIDHKKMSNLILDQANILDGNILSNPSGYLENLTEIFIK